MDYLLTWNCKHIANAETRNLIVTACRAEGYEPPDYLHPRRAALRIGYVERRYRG